MGADRAAVAAGRAQPEVPGQAAGGRAQGAERHSVRVVHRDPVGVPAAGAGLRLGDDVPASAAGLERGWGLAKIARVAAFRAARRGAAGLLPRRGRLLSPAGGPPARPRWTAARPAASTT